MVGSVIEVQSARGGPPVARPGYTAQKKKFKSEGERRRVRATKLEGPHHIQEQEFTESVKNKYRHPVAL